MNMKTLALNTFVEFEQPATINSEENLQNLVKSIASGLDDDLFIVLYTVAASNYIGFSVMTPKSGDLTRANGMANIASQHYADGALVYHLIVSPRSLMHETRMMSEIDLTLAEAGTNLADYGFIRQGKIHSFTDVKI